jgi:hypothetical protein
LFIREAGHINDKPFGSISSWNKEYSF